MKELIGEYYFDSPYHKNKKKLPFIVKAVYPRGANTLPDYPLEVSTVEYKGRKRIPINTAYTLEAITDMIGRGYLKKRRMNETIIN